LRFCVALPRLLKRLYRPDLIALSEHCFLRLSRSGFD
jgi:hypothetical protein